VKNASLPPLVILGNPDNRRVQMFQDALVHFGLPPARAIPYADLLRGRAVLSDVTPRGAIVRIESPGEDFLVERLLLAAGADAAAKERSPHLPAPEALALSFDKGRILFPRQWYLGYRKTLCDVERHLAGRDCRWMSHPQDIAVMFDKVQCHARLARAGVPVPRSLGAVGSFDELEARMAQAGCGRVFVKPAHGSSASGVVAYEARGPRHQATTTVEMVSVDGEMRLYNSLRMRVYRDQRQIARLIDAVCQHGVHVERWVPKAGIDGHTFDLRLVVIGGLRSYRTRHAVVRQSRSPITNLHLMNARGNLEAVLARLGEARWRDVRETCERAMACFAGSLYAGIDLLLTPDYRQHRVLEVNAFGDLLPRLLWQGMDTYQAEVQALLDLYGPST
jgi:glutathione synthase/RimK-type ligase-like ATP-grasp enzyme